MDENDTTTSSTYHNMTIALEELGILDYPSTREVG